MREFSLLGRLSHPHVVRIYNQGFSDKLAYIAMEYFENGDLRGRMRAPMAPREVIALATQVASALEAAHEVGIVHRDLKPENLMVRANGEVVLADFGIAKLAGGAAAAQPTLTRHGELLGSPSYMSPEQVTGRPVTHRADLYALGVVLYELCTGRRPYEAATLMELLAMHVNAALPTLPPESAVLQPVLDRLMAKDPRDRFADAQQVQSSLRALAARLSPSA
jgi:serine/threonine protein kinase